MTKRRTEVIIQRPSREQMLQYIAYDPETGVFTRPNGKRAGGFDPRTQNLVIAVGGKIRKRLDAARLAWFLFHGYVPDAVRHINGNRGDCRIENLEKVAPNDAYEFAAGSV